MKKSSNRGSYAFGLIFFLAGAGFFYLFVATTLIDAYNMHSWRSTDAQLLSAKIDSYESRNDNGGYTTMYKVVARYRFQVSGRDYEGDRPSIDASSTSDRNQHYRLLRKIESEQSKFGAIKIWYNPENPADSVLSRQLNWFSLIFMTSFTSVFMLIGGGLIGYTFMTRNDDKPLPNANPDKLWTTRKNWSSSTIYSQARGSVKLAWFLAALSAFFLGTFALAMIGQHPVATVIGVLLALIPLLVIKRAIRIQREWNRYQQVPLKLSPYPGVIGGAVGGEITIPGKPDAGNVYTVTLSCFNHRTTRSGGKTKSSKSLVWSEDKTIPGKNFINGTGVSFKFYVPAGQPPTSQPDNHYHEWTISIKGDSEAVIFNRDYEIPVFVTEDSQSIEDELKANPLGNAEKKMIEDRLAVKDLGDVIQFETPTSKAAMVFALIGFSFFVIGVAIAVLDSPGFGSLFSLIGAIFGALGLWGWGRNCRVEVSRNGCKVDVFWFSKAVNSHLLTPEDISSITVFKSSSSQSGNSKVEQKYGLRINTKAGKRIDLGGAFNSERNALHMQQRIEQAMIQPRLDELDLS